MTTESWTQGVSCGLRLGALDPSAAEHFVAAIENDRLPRRDGGRRLGELDTDLGRLAVRRDTRDDRSIAIANLSENALALPSRRTRPVPFARDERTRTRRRGADRDPRGASVDRPDVERRSRGDAEAAPLADREALDAVVPSEHATRLVDDVSRDAARRPRADECRGITEAEILAVGLVGDRKGECGGTRANLFLPPRAERERHVLELPAGEREQEVGLIAALVRAATQYRCPVAALDPRVVTGRDDVGAARERPFEQHAELEFAVAGDARIRGPSRRVGSDEAGDDAAVERRALVDLVVRDAEGTSDASGVAVVGADAIVPPRRVPEPERRALDAISPLDQMAELEKKVAELEAKTAASPPAAPAAVTPLRKASGDES